MLQSLHETQAQCRGELTDLYVLCECVEDLFGHSNGFGEVALPVHINHSFPRVVPEEVTNRLLEKAQMNILSSLD